MINTIKVTIPVLLLAPCYKTFAVSKTLSNEQRTLGNAFPDYWNIPGHNSATGTHSLSCIRSLPVRYDT